MNSSSAWTKEEDMIILNAVAAATNSFSLADQGEEGQPQQPFTHWSKLATDQRLTGRTGKAIHHRWVNYLNPNLKNHLYQPFSDDDDLKLWEAQKRIGRKWTQISIECFHSTRSGNQIKNRWKSAGFRKFINKKFNNANTYSDENNNINYNGTINSNSNKRKSDDDNDDGGDDDDDDDDDNDNGDSGDDDDDDDDSDNNFDDDISFDSSDDEAIIYRMKMAEKRNEKKKKKRKRIIEKETETEIEMEMEIDMEGKKRREEEKEKQAKAENDDTAAEEERKLPQQRQRQRRRRILPMAALTQKKNKNENTNKNMGEEQTGRQKQALLPSSSSWTEEEDTIIFNNHLNPNLNHQPFSNNDDIILWEAQKRLGKKWVQISTDFFHSTRSESQIKNRWYSSTFRNFIYKQKKCGTPLKKKEEQKENRMLKEMEKEDKQIKRKNDTADDAAETEGRQRRLVAALACRKKEGDDEDEDEDEDEDADQPPAYDYDNTNSNNDNNDNDDTDDDTDDESHTDFDPRQVPPPSTRTRSRSVIKNDKGNKKGDELEHSNRKRSRDERDEKESSDYVDDDSDYVYDDSDMDEYDDEEEQQPKRHAVNASSSSSSRGGNNKNASSSSSSSSCSSSSLLKKSKIDSTTSVVETNNSTVTRRPNHHRRRGLPLRQRQHSRQIATVQARSTIEKDKGDNNPNHTTTRRNDYNDRIDDEEESCDDNSDDDDYGNGNDDDQNVDSKPPAARGKKGRLKSWPEMYQKLVTYKEQHKNTNVSTRDKKDPQLGSWVMTQRTNYKYNELLPGRLTLLNSIGFEWKLKETDNNKLWMDMFQKLVTYKEQHNNTMVRQKQDLKLGQWVSVQRYQYKNDKLPPNRIDLLNSIDFHLGSVKTWKEQTTLRPHTRQTLIDTQSRSPVEKEDKGDNSGDPTINHNGSNDPIDDEDESYDDNSDNDDEEDDEEEEEFLPKDNTSLRSHHNEDSKPKAVRGKRRKNKAKIELNDNDRIDDEDESSDDNSDDDYDKNDDQSDDNSDDDYDKNDDQSVDSKPPAARGERKRNKAKEIKWMDRFARFQKLVAYKKQHKNANISKCYKVDPKLRGWVSSQRTAYRKDKLLPNQMNLLNSIGFEWNTQGEQHNQVWMEMLKRLETYKEQHNNTMVPIKKDRKIGHWASNQRQYYRDDKLLPNRIDLLNSINFEWKIDKVATDQRKWMDMYQKLIAYKEQHKNTMVPCLYSVDPKLSNWAMAQRNKYKNDKLLPNRIDLLNSINFEWKIDKEATYRRKATDKKKWMDMYQKLIPYKEQHKNTMVPRQYKKDPSLGHWVRKQRQRYRKDELLPNRIDLLNSIDFEWVGCSAKNS